MIKDRAEKQAVARQVLEELTDYFEHQETRERYIRESGEQSFFCAREQGSNIGFLCLKETGKATVELAVMGVLKGYHRMGVGKGLFQLARESARAMGYAFMQVKTVKMGVYEDYDRTNRFYLSMGFQEMEVLPLWDEDNPCQVYIMAL